MAALFVERHHFGHLIRHEIHMFHGKHRQFNADHAPHFACPQPAAIDDMLGHDGALIGHNVPAAVSPLLELFHLGFKVDFSTTNLGRFGVGVRRAIGVEITIGLVEHRADKIFILQQRHHLLGFFGGENFRFKPEIAGAGMGHFQPVHAVMRISQHQPARAMQTA